LGRLRVELGAQFFFFLRPNFFFENTGLIINVNDPTKLVQEERSKSDWKSYFQPSVANMVVVSYGSFALAAVLAQ
jgi:hypothetical protein